MIRINVYGYPKLLKNFIYAQKEMDRKMIRPALMELRDKMMKTLRSVFVTGTGPYQHGATGKYLSSLRSKTYRESLEIESREDYGKFIIGGTRGQGGDIVKPLGVVEWAMQKLGVPEVEGWAIAQSIAEGGIGGGGSHLRSEYPAGEPRFAFPEWIVEKEHKHDIASTARRVGELVVHYLDR